jgi:CO/xanthine dehydrogenase FAD-binding subunit
MKPAPFAYRRPDTLEEALAIFAELGSDAKPLAGGQSLVPAMNFRLARPEVLVDLNRLDPLAYIHETPDGGLRIGAMTRQRSAERSSAVASRASLFSEAMPWVAHPQIRNRGTVGGSLAHADPAAELPAVMVALEAQLVLQSRIATRTVPAQDFFTGILSTVLKPDELLTEIQIPASPARTGAAFMELARRHGDFALVGVAVAIVLDEREECRSARIVLMSVGDGPVLATRAMAELVGRVPTASRIEEAARVAAETEIDPPSDIHASSAYRRHLAKVLVRRALTRAAERAAEASGAAGDTAVGR